MSDDRRFLERVASGREADPCSYRCVGAPDCTRATGHQADKTATGLRLLTEREQDALRPLGVVGSYVCPAHEPHSCTYCGQVIPWFDGSVCDYCDRYTDEGDPCDEPS